MPRTISISTGVFAAIWAKREGGEESEDEILARLLDCSDSKSESNKSLNNSTKGTGFYDTRNDVSFPEGFEIFRNYKGKFFKAIANDGKWVRTDTHKSYASLNQLNESIAAGPENVWNGNWKYKAPNGIELSIDTLRQ